MRRYRTMFKDKYKVARRYLLPISLVTNIKTKNIIYKLKVIKELLH